MLFNERQRLDSSPPAQDAPCHGPTHPRVDDLNFFLVVVSLISLTILLYSEVFIRSHSGLTSAQYSYTNLMYLF